MPNKPVSQATKFGWSYLTQWSTCQTRWWNSQLRRHPKAPKGQLGIEKRTVPDYLVIGSAFHKFAEDWFMSGWDGSKDTGIRELDEPLTNGVELVRSMAHKIKGGPDIATKAEAIVRGLTQGYHQYYQHDTLRVAVADDGTPLVEQEFTLEVGTGYLFTARLDTVVFDPTDPTGLWDLEHKTADASKVNGLKEAFYIDGQITGQQLQMEAQWGDRVRGVKADIAVKRAKEIEPYQRKDYHRPQAQLEKFQMDARRRLAAIKSATDEYNHLLDCHMSQDEAARVAFDASHSGTQICTGCDFFALCKNRAQSEWLVEMDYLPKEPR